MIRNSSVHQNGGHLSLLAALTIGAAVAATATTPVLLLGGMRYLAVQAKFLYGAGGTTVNAYIQTSLDAGLSWFDIMQFAFTTAAATKISVVQAGIALTPVTVPGDGALTANTIVDGVLGDRLRLKYVTTGTYTGASSLAVDAVVKG